MLRLDYDGKARINSEKLQDLLVTQVCEEVREGVSEAGERLQAVRAREAGDV